MKVKDTNFGHENFCQRQKRKLSFVLTPKKKYNPLKMLTLNDFAESLRDVCPESMLFSAVAKPEVDFVTDLAKQQTDEVTENLCSVYNSRTMEMEAANQFFELMKKKLKNLVILTKF